MYELTSHMAPQGAHNMPLPTSNMPHEQVEHTVRIFITVSSISIVITVGPSASRAVLITRATTSARASA